MTSKRLASRDNSGGRLRVGDDWNAITIIALSQSNPLKAVAEFVENSIDARAANVVITRGRERGEPYLRITDDGEGIPRDNHGAPDFRYVATHICDSIKRRLKANGATGIQGEFGIGLLSFWTVGQTLTMTNAATDGRTWQMRMQKDDPDYSVVTSRRLFPEQGTEIMIKPLLPGIRQLSGEKMQWYLAAELRDRIRKSGVRVRIVDRQARKEYEVEPRQFSGRLLHDLPRAGTEHGDVYVELYLGESDDLHVVGLYRRGTRVLASIAELDVFRHSPWTDGYLQGVVDAPFINLTPGTRTGVVHDRVFAAFRTAMGEVGAAAGKLIEEQRQAEEEQATRQTLRTIQRAFREALLALPPEEYDWFDIGRKAISDTGHRATPGTVDAEAITESPAEVPVADDTATQKQFFEFAGPLHKVRILPASCVVPVAETRNFRAQARDRRGRQVEENLHYRWEIIDGEGYLENADREILTFRALKEPGLARLQVTVTQEQTICEAEALITVTDSLLPNTRDSGASQQGLPGYTFERAAGSLWRSRLDTEQNVIVINSGHRDFVYAARVKARKLRYIARLYAKELVYKNFPGMPTEQLLERLIELSLYTEEHLK
jgi:hypothetical protein